MLKRRNWTREEEIIVLDLYCRIPFKNSSKNHPDVIKIAKLINRSPSSVNMKIGNFGSFDLELKRKGIVGLSNASKLDEQIWNEFNGSWDKLAFESEMLLRKFKNKNVFTSEKCDEEKVNVLGGEKIISVKQRINQSFFRASVLSSYNNTCCITGINTPMLLIASHIKPWKNCSDSEKTNPCNGLCMNALHDKAFDRGYMTVTPKGKIRISNSISDIFGGAVVEKYFGIYENKDIILPEKFVPDKLFLEYHNDVIYESFK